MRNGLLPRHFPAPVKSRRPARFLLLAGICLCAGVAWALPGGDPVAGGGEPEQPPVSPRDVIVLFNGRDLSGLSHWLEDTKRSDPRGVFRVQDSLLWISGEGQLRCRQRDELPGRQPGSRPTNLCLGGKILLHQGPLQHPS